MLDEDFSSITKGNSTDSGGANESWNGNDNFPDVVKAYQAGGAVKIGASSSSGSITTRPLDLSVGGGAFKVTFDVKGWTKVEGDIKVSLDGKTPQVVSYTSVMSGDFETKELNFTGGTSSSTITFATSAKRAYLDNIRISYVQGEQTQVTAPVFSPASMNFIDQLTVTASCATDGATIHYTTDGTTPTAESDVFPAEGLPITETTTLKAMAVADGLDNSEVAEATYTKTEIQGLSIAEFKALDANATGTLLLNDVVVTAVGSNDIYIQDAEGNGIDLYKSGQSYEIGDVLNGYIKGMYAEFNNMPELTNGDFSNVVVTKGGTVTPKVVTIAELVASPETYYCSLVRIEEADYANNTFTQGGSSIAFYDKFYTIDDDYAWPSLVNVTGIFYPHYEELQLAPRTEADIENASNLQVPTFAWSATSFTADVNAQSVSYPVLTNNSDGAVSYESSATDVATIDAATGVIELVGVGSTTITANVTATENYYAASASYTLTVVDPSALGEPVAFVGERDGGDYAMMNSMRGSNKLHAQAVTVVNDKVISPENVDMISWYADESRGTIQNAAGEYVAYVSSTDIKLQVQSFKWTVSDGLWTSGTRALGVNGSNDDYYIGAYGISDDTYPKVRMMPIVDGYTRAVTANTYGTICLPYAVAAGDLAGAEFFSIAGKVTGTDSKVDYLVLNAVTELEAGKPYIFSATSDMLLAAYNGEAVAEAASDNGLKGTFAGQNVAEGMYMITDNAVQLCGTGCSIAANRAYINMDEVAEYTESVGVNQRMLPLDGGTTGIETVEAAEADALVNVYTLSGVEVRHQVRAAEATDGLQRGIYIVNGKKMVVK